MRTRTSSSVKLRAVPGHGAAGFTLIELLVSLALMGLAATLLLQALQAAATLARRDRVNESSLDEVAAAQRVLRGRVERLRTVTRLDSALPIVDARGTGNDFMFVAPAPDRAAPSALQRYKLVRDRDGALRLYTATTRDDGSADRFGVDLSRWTPTTLLPATSSLAIDYFGPSRLGGAPGWQRQWSDRPQPPALVRIRVGFPAGDRRRWPDLVIRPRATIEGRCKIDPLTGDCEVLS